LKCDNGAVANATDVDNCCNALPDLAMDGCGDRTCIALVNVVEGMIFEKNMAPSQAARRICGELVA
jgi:hypothetical protein